MAQRRRSRAPAAGAAADPRRGDRARASRPAIGSRRRGAAAKRREAVVEQRAGRRRGRRWRAQAGYTRTNHVERVRRAAAEQTQLRVHLSRRSRQLPHAARSAVADLHRRPRSTRSSAPPAPSAGVGARTRDAARPICGSRSRAPSGRSSPRASRSACSSSRSTSIDAHLRDVRNQLDAGLIPPNEVLSAEAQQSRQRMLRDRGAQPRATSPRPICARLIGVDARAPIEPAGDARSRAAGAGRDARCAGRARRAAQRPERARARASASTAAGERGRRPRPARSRRSASAAAYDYARPNPRIFPRADAWQTSWDVGVNVSWSLWDGGRARAEAAAGGRRTRRRPEPRLARVRSPARGRSAAAVARASTRPRPPIAAADDGVARGRPKRAAWSASASAPAWSTQHRRARRADWRCCRPSSIARARWPTSRLAEARLARAVGR